MARAKTDREWDNLSRAFDRLFRIWCVLTNTPGPGNRKPGRASPGPSSAPALYLVPDSVPAPADGERAPASPDNTTSLAAQVPRPSL
jgi:hypothetical protein